MAVDYENDILLVTCASGKQSPHLIRHLLPKWKRLRLQAHSTASVQRLEEQYPDAEVVQADMQHPDDAAKLIAGVTGIYHVGPSFHPHETQIGYTMIDAAVTESQKPGSKFQHFVYSSVIQTQLRKLLNHDAKRYVEEHLQESGLRFTILQPSHFLNNFPLAALMAQQENPPVWRAPYGMETAFSFAILEDYGEAAARVFEEREKHYFAQYPIVSTYPIQYSEIVAEASRATGKEIRVEKVPFDEAVSRMLKGLAKGGGNGEEMRFGCERLLLYYSRRGLVGSPTVLEWLIGRKAMTPREYMVAGVERVRAEC